MEVEQGQRLVEDLVEDCRMMSCLRMGKSGEIGCVNGLMFEYVCRRDEFWEIGLGFGEVIDGCLGEVSLGLVIGGGLGNLDVGDLGVGGFVGLESHYP